jgi:hypothetical protein
MSWDGNNWEEHREAGEKSKGGGEEQWRWESPPIVMSIGKRTRYLKSAEQQRRIQTPNVSS